MTASASLKVVLFLGVVAVLGISRLYVFQSSVYSDRPRFRVSPAIAKLIGEGNDALASDVVEERNDGLNVPISGPGTTQQRSLKFPTPELFNLMEMLEAWPNDDTSPESYENPQHTSIRHFDYMTEQDLILQYRREELPFVVTNFPGLDAVREKWSDEYLSRKLGGKTMSVETAVDNHFMYNKVPANKKLVPADWVAPTKNVRMTFDEWVQHAYDMDGGVGDTYYYFYVNGWNDKTKVENPWVVEDLDFLAPKPGLFMANDVSGHRGINCRFGMKGITAAAHFDSKRNFVAIMRGQKRYILLPPMQCNNLYFYETGHPSARHTQVEWNDPDIEQFPLFAEAQATQVVLKQGELLYIPSFWVHHIISLGTNLQCNSRSSVGWRDRNEMATVCGFPM